MQPRRHRPTDIPCVSAVSVQSRCHHTPRSCLTIRLRILHRWCSLINTNPMLLVNPRINARTAVELVALSKSTTNGMNYATAGIGGLTHFASIFRVRNQIPLTAVTYRGGALATAAIVSGEVPFLAREYVRRNGATRVRHCPCSSHYHWQAQLVCAADSDTHGTRACGLSY